MGYTTDFEGEFRCRRNVAPAIAAFLTEIEPDSRSIPVFADWLEDQQDERAQRVRQCKSFPQVHAIFHALAPEHAAYLRAFNETRRMARDSAIAATLPDPVREGAGLPIGVQGGYFVGGEGYAGQSEDPSVRDYNRPPRGQPGLWCGWTPTDDGTAIVWDGGEKFYSYVEWLEYLIEHFLAPWGYFLDGQMEWQGEEDEDTGVITVHNNVVKAVAEGRRR
jgi:hypothetical protein